ncbi:MAG: MFS transporter [Chloroflexota bacterium]|nr:MFS transporter [Chloroflexota bacterium]
MKSKTSNTQEEFQTGGVILVSTAHAVHDTYTGFLPALLPILIDKFQLTNTTAGLLTVFMRIPSLLQPIIGRIADRKNLKFLIILAPTITGAAMSLLSIAPGYGFLAFLLIIAGISSGALHAIGPVLGSNMSGNKLGKGMSFWMVGGELGRALGPIIVVTAIGYITLDGLPWLMLGGILASCFLYVKLRSATTLPQEVAPQINWTKALRKMRGLMIPMTILIFTRTMMTASLTTYLPTFLTTQGSSLWFAGASLSILEVSGMVGSFLSGPLSDRFGRRRMLVISFIATPLLMFLFVHMNNLFRIPLLALLGFFAISVTPVILAIVMENAPANRSFTNGVYMALSFVLSALSTLLVGLLSDLVNLRTTFLISACILPVGLPFIFLLPKSIRHTHKPEKS